MSNLFSPINLGNLTLANRIVIPPMCQYSAQEGHCMDWHRIHYGQLAESGAGLLITEATAVSPEGCISPWDLGIWSEDLASSLARALYSMRSVSPTPVFVQLAHAGRKAAYQRPWEGGGPLTQDQGAWQTLAPSAIPFDAGHSVPLPLDQNEMDRLTIDFAQGAKRVLAAGFDGIELHAAHGYLLHQFLSPLSNKRADEYGGTLKNRMRFPLRVFTAVREAVNSCSAGATQKPVLGVRVSATDWTPGGWNPEECAVFAQELERLGCDYLHVSSGGLHPEQKIPLGPGYQVPLAAAMKAKVAMPVIAVGLITEPELAESILLNHQADMVALGRAMLYNPRWPWHAAAKLSGAVKIPPQYLRSAPHGVKHTLV